MKTRIRQVKSRKESKMLSSLTPRRAGVNKSEAQEKEKKAGAQEKKAGAQEKKARAQEMKKKAIEIDGIVPDSVYIHPSTTSNVEEKEVLSGWEYLDSSLHTAGMCMYVDIETTIKTIPDTIYSYSYIVIFKLRSYTFHADGAHEKEQKEKGRHPQLSKHKKKSLKKQKEERIREIEARRKAGIIAPTNAAEFEQMVMSSPNSSYVWIQYMAFVTAQGELDRARALAKRAIDTITFREDGERLNMWVAWINLENNYGDAESTMEVFKRALQQTSQYKLYKAVLDIFEHTGKIDMAQQVASNLCKRYGDVPESWIRCIRFWLGRGDAENAKVVFDKSMQALPKRHHVYMSTQAALLEFKLGDPEKGRSMLEGVLQDNPKRTDIWSVYLDQEIGHGDEQRARTLFERATHVVLPPKKMKFLFKRYLDFEKKYGDAKRVEYVKKKAMEYVERVMAGSDVS